MNSHTPRITQSAVQLRPSPRQESAMKHVGAHLRYTSVQKYQLDLHEPEVLSAWQAVLAKLETCGQSNGVAALLLRNRAAELEPVQISPLLEQTQSRLLTLVSSTREVDISSALTAALPLIGTSPGVTFSGDDFLIGYVCGLRTSPLLDVRYLEFLREFGDAMVATSVCSPNANRAWIKRTVYGGCPPWVRVVLEAVGYGSAALSALLAERAMKSGRASSGRDTILGALLGSVLWKACPHETELISRLCGSPISVSQLDMSSFGRNSQAGLLLRM